VRRLVHVVRAGVAPLAAVVAAGDWVVYEDGAGWRLDAHGDPPLPPGSIDDTQLHDLVFAADASIVW
jgi:hypothetical protein